MARQKKGESDFIPCPGEFSYSKNGYEAVAVAIAPKGKTLADENPSDPYPRVISVKKSGSWYNTSKTPEGWQKWLDMCAFVEDALIVHHDGEKDRAAAQQAARDDAELERLEAEEAARIERIQKLKDAQKARQEAGSPVEQEQDA